MNAPAIHLNPYGYGAKNTEEVLRYLTRSVNNVVLASDESVCAAEIIKELQSQLKQKNKATTADQKLQQELDELRSKLASLETENTTLKMEKELDEQRIKYCLENSIIYSNGFLYADLEQEEVVDGNFRKAIDLLSYHI